MKSSDWVSSGVFFMSFHFLKHVLLTSLLLAVLFSLPTVPLFFGTVATQLTLSYKIMLLGKIISLSFAGALVPFFVARLGSLFLFPNLEPSVQLLTSVAIFIFTSVCNVLAAIAENPVLASEYNGLGFLVSGSGGSYRAVLMILWVAVFGAAAIRKIREPFSSTLRIARAMSLLAVLLVALLVDWQISAYFRRVNPANRDPSVVHEITVLVPHLDRANFDSIINLPALDEWKANIRFVAKVAPSSESELAQIVTLLSGMQPWQHGVRKDYLNENEQLSLSEHLSQTFSPPNSPQTHVFSLGTTSSIADVLSGNLSQLCSLSPKTTIAVRAAEKLLIAYAQVPEKLVPLLFPESKCTQKLAPLSQLALHELQKYGRLFATKQNVKSMWWLDPATGSNEAPEELAKRRVISLQNTFAAMDAHLNLLDLRKNTRIKIVGLGRRNMGMVAIISEEPNSSLSSLPTVAKNAQILLSSAQASNLLKHANIDPTVVAYSESPQWEHIPPSDSEESRAAFYASRSVFCAWKTLGGTEGAKFSLKPTDEGVGTASESIAPLVLIAPVLESRELCEQYAHSTFRFVLDNDISISNRAPALSLFDSSISARSWQAPIALQPNNNSNPQEPVAK